MLTSSLTHLHSECTHPTHLHVCIENKSKTLLLGPVLQQTVCFANWPILLLWEQPSCGFHVSQLGLTVSYSRSSHGGNLEWGC